MLTADSLVRHLQALSLDSPRQSYQDGIEQLLRQLLAQARQQRVDLQLTSSKLAERLDFNSPSQFDLHAASCASSSPQLRRAAQNELQHDPRRALRVGRKCWRGLVAEDESWRGQRRRLRSLTAMRDGRRRTVERHEGRIGRTSAFQSAGRSDLDAEELGRPLGVGVPLERLPQESLRPSTFFSI